MTTPAAPPLAPSHLHLVHAAALRQTRNPDAAADITQAVFLLLARKCAAHRAPLDARLTGWLLTVTAYTVKAWQRSQRRRAFHERRAPARQEPPVMPSTDQILLIHLDAALLELPVLDREILSRRYLEDQPLAAIAAALNLSENTAGKRAARALEKLRTRLARRGIPATILPALLLSQSHRPLPPLPPVPSSSVTLLAKTVEGRLALPKLALAATLTTAAALTALLLVAPHLHLAAAPPARLPQLPAPVAIAPKSALTATLPANHLPVSLFAYDPDNKSFQTAAAGPGPATLELRFGVAASIDATDTLSLFADRATTDTLTLDLAALPFPDKPGVTAALQKQLAPLTHPHLTVLVTTPNPTDAQLALLWPLLLRHSTGQPALIFLGTTTLHSANLASPESASTAPSTPATPPNSAER